MKGSSALGLGLVATLAASALWHGPGGASARLGASLNREVRVVLDNYEMRLVRGEVERNPASRRIMLQGPADDFQRGEIKRLTEGLRGVAGAQWSRDNGRSGQLPLLAEVMLMAVACFAAGAVLAYVGSLRRRAREAWRS